MLRCLLPLAIAMAGLVPPAHAFAFNLARTGSGQPMRWNVGPGEALHYTIDDGVQSELGMSSVFVREVVAKAFATWAAVRCRLCHDPRGAACSPIACGPNSLGLSFAFDGFAPRAPWGPQCVGPAGQSTPVTVRGCPPTGGPWKKAANGNQVMFLAAPGEWVFGRSTIALTLVAANDVTGVISDADILLDAEYKRFCEPPCKPAEYDLQSTITHEVGHFLGLDHSTEPGATMIAQGLGAQTFMRDLSPDDEAGICTAYRMAWDPKGCPPPEDPGFLDCGASPTSSAPASTGIPLALLLATSLLLLLSGRLAGHGAPRSEPLEQVAAIHRPAARGDRSGPSAGIPSTAGGPLGGRSDSRSRSGPLYSAGTDQNRAFRSTPAPGKDRPDQER